MIEPNFRDAIAEYIARNALPVDKFSHQPRLYQLAKRLAEDRVYDDDVLYAAAWLHDIGVFIGHRPEDPEALARWDNVAYAAQKIPALLQEFGFPSQKMEAVLEVVRNHLPSGKPTSIEGILLRDADILEQLGAIGILRNVSKVGRDTRFSRFADILKVLRRNAEQLPQQLQLQSARQMAESRVQLLRSFLESTDEESCGVSL